MIHGLCNNNKNSSNRKRLKKSSRHLKMVGKVIWLGATLRHPTDNGNNKGMADIDNIVCQTKFTFPSTSHHLNHHRRRTIPSATAQVPNNKEMLPSVPNDNYNNNNNKDNDNGNISANRG